MLPAESPLGPAAWSASDAEKYEDAGNVSTHLPVWPLCRALYCLCWYTSRPCDTTRLVRDSAALAAREAVRRSKAHTQAGCMHASGQGIMSKNSRELTAISAADAQARDVMSMCLTAGSSSTWAAAWTACTW